MPGPPTQDEPGAYRDRASSLSRLAVAWEARSTRSVGQSAKHLSRGSFGPAWAYAVAIVLSVGTTAAFTIKMGLTAEGLGWSAFLVLFWAFVWSADRRWTKEIRAASGRQQAFLWATTYGSPVPVAIFTIPIMALRAVLILLTGEGRVSLMVLSCLVLAILLAWPSLVEWVWEHGHKPPQDYPMDRRGM